MAETEPAWKKEVNARLSAHRNRRGASAEQQPAFPGMEAVAAPVARAARVAARVAERYAKVPTYSEVLAAEAANAARAAEAAARAAHEAHQAAQAVTDVLRAGLDIDRSAAPDSHAAPRIEMAPRPDAIPEPVHYHVDPASLPSARGNQSSRNQQTQSATRSAVDPYPHIVDPFEDALIAPAQSLAARVLEFPRELVAARKARPRFAEGPLRDPGARAGEDATSHLRGRTGSDFASAACAFAGALVRPCIGRGSAGARVELHSPRRPPPQHRCGDGRRIRKGRRIHANHTQPGA